MSDFIDLCAEERSLTQSVAVLRSAGKIPAVLYGKNKTPTHFTISKKAFLSEYYAKSLTSRIVNLSFKGEKYYSLVKDIQLHPVTDMPIHIDFLKVDMNSSVKVFLPFRAVNAENCQGIKRGGILNMVSKFAEFHCAAQNIPTQIDVDVSQLIVGDKLYIKDIKLTPDISCARKDNFVVLYIVGKKVADEAEVKE